MSLLVLLYTALAVFFIANLIRFVRVMRMPVHLRWELYPVPHESPDKVKYGGSYLEDTDYWTKKRHSNLFGEVKVFLSEVLFLKGVWENNKPLWFWSLLFHYGLYFMMVNIAIVVIVSILNTTGIFTLGMAASGLALVINQLVTILFWVSSVAGTVGTFGVILVRFFSSKLRPYTSFATFFNLLVIFLLFGTAFVSLLTVGNSTITGVFDLLDGLFSFEAVRLDSGIALAHFIILAFFLIYFPFTHMTHLYMKYFTYHSIRWDDELSMKGGRIEKKVGKYLDYPVTWSARHIQQGGGGTKTWKDVVTKRGIDDE